MYIKDESNHFANIALTIFGSIYIAIPFAFLISISNFGSSDLNYKYEIPLGFFILTWSSDTFAYLSGRSFGKHKLFERISPKKTWEGLIGGAICTIGIGFLISNYFNVIKIIDWLVISAIIIIFGTFGDLIESLFKRTINVKESGNILPGHGGVLDRFDATFLSIPIIYFYFKLFIF